VWKQGVGVDAEARIERELRGDGVNAQVNAESILTT